MVILYDGVYIVVVQLNDAIHYIKINKRLFETERSFRIRAEQELLFWRSFVSG